MKEIKIVIGTNFGDEGKGLMTNFFALNFPKEENVLNVRFNGTSQAGHTIVTEEKSHVFSHFGAGSFNSNVVTYLSSFFFVNPIHFNEEYNKLVSLGVEPKVYVSSKCPVITIFDIMYNRDIEISRGNNRHGSCGAGLWEAVLREKADFNLSVEDLKKGVFRLSNFVKNIRDTYYLDKFKKDNIEEYKGTDDALSWDNDRIIDIFVDECKLMLSRVEVVDEKEILNQFSYIVFEGAQGLLLDWNNREYMPNLTASRTGLTNVNELLKLIEEPFNVEVCYVTRSYFTRHGAGRFETEVENKEVLGLKEDDKTNVTNPWQGSFRYGYFDLPLFQKMIEKDLKEYGFGNLKKSICVTHLDETNLCVLTSKKIDIKDFISLFGKDWNFYVSLDRKSSCVMSYKDFLKKGV